MTKSLREKMIEEHASLEQQAEECLGRLAHAGDGVAEAWHALAERLRAHFTLEEERLVPALRRVSEQGARVVLNEHRHLRGRLVEVANAISAGTAHPLCATLVDELRAHGRSEDRLLYTWAETALDEVQRMEILGRLGGGDGPGF